MKNLCYRGLYSRFCLKPSRVKTHFLPLLTTLATLLFQGAEAYDQDSRFYGKVLGGYNFLQNNTLSGNRVHYGTGYLVSGAVGCKGCGGLSLEGEYSYRRNSLSKIHFVSEGSSRHGHLQTSSYMANLLWDLPFCSPETTTVRPFIGAGLGYNFTQLHSSNSRIIFDQKWRHFSWQAIAGVAYPLNCAIDLSLEYRFHQAGSRFYNHALGIGLQYTFNPSLY